MTISFSAEVMRAMGFGPIPDNQPLVASFHSLSVYSVQGLTLTDASPTAVRSTLSGISYAFALGQSANGTTQELLHDDLADDEDAWSKEHRCGPPYLIVHVGPTSAHSCSNGQFKQDAASFTTHDAFSLAKDELRTLEDRVLPMVLNAIYCTFSTDSTPVRLVPVSREVFGLTPAGVVVHDIRFQMNASMFVSRRLSTDELREGMEAAASLATRVHPKASRFFRLGTEERDVLKRFLYSFLTLEIETHATFASIDHAASVARVVTSEARVQMTSSAFFEAQRERWTNLFDRFVWCAISAWRSLTDADVQEFKRLKKVRDDIAHGSISEPTEDDVRAAQQLALKIQRCRA